MLTEQEWEKLTQLLRAGRGRWSFWLARQVALILWGAQDPRVS